MATDRFYRLPKEKQNAILKAAVKEFAQVPFEKVSINKIIQDADISRGSFYTYFEDKRDILRYIFSDWQNVFQAFCTKAMEMYRGDIWAMLEGLLINILEYFSRVEMISFLRNVMNSSNSEEFFSGFSKEHCVMVEGQKLEQWLYEQTDKTEFRLTTPEEFHRFLEISMTIMLMALKDMYQGDKTLEQVKEDYYSKLQILRYGVCR